MSFKLASNPTDSTVPIVERDLPASTTFTQGSLLVVNGSGQYTECGADPASIAAVAATPAGLSTGFTVLSRQEFPPNKMQGINVGNEAVFRANYIGTLPASDGGVYGVVRDTDLKWKVDFTDTSNTRVKLVGRLTNSPENQPEVLVKFIAANIQQN